MGITTLRFTPFSTFIQELFQISLENETFSPVTASLKKLARGLKMTLPRSSSLGPTNLKKRVPSQTSKILHKHVLIWLSIIYYPFVPFRQNCWKENELHEGSLPSERSWTFWSSFKESLGVAQFERTWVAVWSSIPHKCHITRCQQHHC